MTSPAPVFGLSGDYRARAGSTVQINVSVKNRDGTLVDLTGREVFYSFYNRATQAELLTRSATGDGTSAILPPITGDDHFDLQNSNSRLQTNILIGYYVGQGYVELSEGRVTIMPAPRTLVSEAEDLPEQVNLDVTLPGGAVMVTMRGAPGMPIWQALGLTLEQYRAEQAQSGADAGAAAGEIAGAAAGAEAGGTAGATAGAAAGKTAGASAGATAGAAAGATAGSDAAAPAIKRANDAADNANAALAPAVASASDSAKTAAARAAEAGAARDVTTQFAGVTKTYATFAQADADKGNVADKAFVLVMVDADRGSRSTVYQKQGSGLTFITETARGSWAVLVAYAGEAAIRATVAGVLAAGGGTVLLPPGQQRLTSPLPAAKCLRYAGVRPQLDLANIPDNPWSFTANNVGTVLVGDGTFAAIAGNNVAAADPTEFTNAAQQAFGNGALKHFGVTNIGFDGFSRALDLGARNVPGVIYGEISWLWVRNCTDWGISLTNCMHTPTHHIWGVSDKSPSIGHGFRMVSDCDPRILIPGNLTLGDIYWYQGNYAKYGIRIGSYRGGIWNQMTTSGRVQCNRFGGETVTQAATMTTGSTAIGVSDTSKFPIAMPVVVSATANGFTANRTYFVKSRSTETGAGNITLADREVPFYSGGVLAGGAEIAATGSTAVNLLSNGMPHLSIIGGLEAVQASGTGLVLHSQVGHLDLEGFSTVALHAENVGNAGVFDLIEVTAASLLNVCFRRVANAKLFVGKEAIVDIDSGSPSTIVMGSIKTFGNIRPFGLLYDFTDDRPTLQIRPVGGLKPDFAAHYLTGGSALQTGATLLRNVLTPTGGVINLDLGRAGVLPVNFGGTNAFTLPTITNAAVKNTWVGVPYEIVALAGAVTINTDGTQTFNGVAGRTSIVIPKGGSVQLCAVTGASGALHWAILGGVNVDVLRDDGNSFDPAAIAVGASVRRTYTMAGARIGDRIEVGISVDQQGIMLHPWVSAADTVTIDYVNPPWNAGTIDLPSHLVYLTVRRRS